MHDYHQTATDRQGATQRKVATLSTNGVECLEYSVGSAQQNELTWLQGVVDWVYYAAPNYLGYICPSICGKKKLA